MKVDVTTEISFLSAIKAIETFSYLGTFNDLTVWHAEQLEKAAKRIRERLERPKDGKET